MKYIVKNTVINHNKELYPEGSIINLEGKDALALKNFLQEIPMKEQENFEEELKKPKQPKTKGDK